MTFEPANAQQHFVPTEIILPEENEKMILILKDKLKKIVEALNDKEVGQYDTVTLVNGENWFTPGDANGTRVGTRLVVDIRDDAAGTTGLLDHGAVVTTQSVPHGITTTANTRFTHIYGVATDPGASTLTQSIPLPYVDVDVLGNGIELWVDATNVNLRYAPNYSAFTTAYVILEWVENA